MQVSVESTSALERRMTVGVSVERIETEVNKRLQQTAQKAKIAGFRPGKVPMNVVAQRYGYSVQYEVMNDKMGEAFAEKANAAKGPVAFLIPLKGVSILDGDGEMFCDREADQAMFDALKANLRDDIPVVEIDANINDAARARRLP